MALFLPPISAAAVGEESDLFFCTLFHISSRKKANLLRCVAKIVILSFILCMNLDRG